MSSECFKTITLVAVENSPEANKAVERTVRCASSLPTAPPGFLCTLIFAQDAMPACSQKDSSSGEHTQDYREEEG